MVLKVVEKIHNKIQSDPLARQVFACYADGNRLSCYWFTRAFKHGCFCNNKDFWQLTKEEHKELKVFFDSTHAPAQVLAKVGILDYESTT